MVTINLVVSGNVGKLALLCVAQFVVVLDVTIVAVALPAIQADLGFTDTGLQWVLTAYVLVFGGALLVAGRAGDLYGSRRLFAAGLVLFAVASLGCGLAAGPGALVAGRAVQGLGAALLSPAALALLTAIVPEGEPRARALAAWTAAAAAGGASGWVLGGLLVDGLGWPAVFLVNVPLGLAGAVLARAWLPERREPGAPAGLDLAGALAVTAGLALVVFGLAQAEAAGPLAPLPAGTLAAGLGLLWLFARIERRAASPLLAPGTLRRPGLGLALLVAVALTASTSPAMFLYTLHLQGPVGLGPLAAGLACAPLNLAVIAGSALGPRVARRLGRPGTMALGAAVVTAGIGLLAPLGAAVAPHVPALALMGAGLGCASVASTAAGAAAAGDQEGLVAGLLTTAAQLGTVAGLAVFVPLAAAFGGPGPGYRWAIAGAALAAAAGAVAAAVRRRVGAPVPNLRSLRPMVQRRAPK